MKTETKERIWNWVMFVSLILIFFAIASSLFEVYMAYKFCDSVEGDYHLDILHAKHYCDGESISKYRDISESSFWAFDKDFNFTDFSLKD